MRHSQNRRSRSRSRKGPNPLTRSYESNGPDVKVRGTAAHVAEKYMSLARDAQSSGDIVAAENYLQHAEHYNRIVMAAQAQYQQNQPQQYREGPDEGYDDERSTNGRFRDRYEYNGDSGREEEGDEQPFEAGDEGGEERTYQPRPPRPDYRQQQQQPQQQRGPRPDRYDYRGQPGGYDRGDRDDRQQRSDRGERQERYDRPERSNGPEQAPRPESYSRAESGPEQPAQPVVMEPAGEAPSSEQPSPAPEVQPSSSRRRRGRPPRTEAAAPSEQDAQDVTRDGETALAAFPE
jgi:hypothetical protein